MSLPAMSYIANGPIAMPHFVSAASTCCGLAPSSSRNRLCWPYFSSMRLPMKPSHTPETTGNFFRLQASLGDRAGVILPDGIHAALDRLLRRVDQRDRQAGVGEAHGDAAAHGAGADDRHLADLAKRRVLGNPRHLGGLALGEE